jgi:hypothetical protein
MLICAPPQYMLIMLYCACNQDVQSCVLAQYFVADERDPDDFEGAILEDMILDAGGAREEAGGTPAECRFACYAVHIQWVIRIMMYCFLVCLCVIIGVEQAKRRGWERQDCLVACLRHAPH